jgi:hypothetical protein
MSEENAARSKNNHVAGLMQVSDVAKLPQMRGICSFSRFDWQLLHHNQTSVT